MPESIVAERPSIPWLVWFSVPLWIASAAGIALVPLWGFRAEPLALCMLASGLVFAALCIASERSALIVPLAGMTLGFMLAWGHSAALLAEENAFETVQCTYRIELLEDPKCGDFATSACACATNAEGRQVKVRVEGACLDGLMCHDEALCTARFIEPNDRTHDRLWYAGCAGTLKVVSAHRIESQRLLALINGFRRGVIVSMAESGSSPLMLALACGWRQELLTSSLYADFKKTGLAHLVAVSGAHLVIVTSTLAEILRVIGFPRKATFALLVMTMLFYYLMAGAPISALRAFVMTAIGLASFSAKRRPHALNALALAMAFMIAADPSASLSLSFALSAFSTLGIVLFARLIAHWFPASKPAQIVGQPIALALSASVFSLPLASSIFAQIPLIAPLSNVVAAPLFAPCCAASLLAGIACMLIPQASSVVIAVASCLTESLAFLVNALAGIPYGCIPASISVGLAIALSFIIAACLWIFWPSRPASIAKLVAAFVCVAVASWAMTPPLGDAIVMLDVGQGDSFLITSESHALLIDTGNQDAKLLGALGHHRMIKLDGVAITHADDDHCGSLDALAQSVEVEHVIVSQPTLAEDVDSSSELLRTAKRAGNEILGMRVGDSAIFGSFEAVCLSPERFVDQGGNDDSLVLLVGYDPDHDGIMDARALFAGDAESEVLEKLVLEGKLENVDILKVSHHGSAGAITPHLLEKLKPEIALISCGKNNIYGHPAKETTELLENHGIPTFRTDCQGEVVCTFEPGGITVTTER